MLRRSKEPEGWTKLGVAQLRLRDLAAAEKSFNTALSIDPDDAEALNGLGLAQMQRGRPRDAAQYFAAAKRAQPDYAPALLNLATVARQYLHDNALALQNYRAYLALTPHRADWDQVNAIANNLEQQMNGAANPSAARIARRLQFRCDRQPTTANARPPARSNNPVRHRSIGTGSCPGSAGACFARTPNPSRLRRQRRRNQTNGKPGVLHQLNPLNWFRRRVARNQK